MVPFIERKDTRSKVRGTNKKRKNHQRNKKVKNNEEINDETNKRITKTKSTH